MKIYFDCETLERKDDGLYYPVLNCKKFAIGGVKEKNKKTNFFTDRREMKEEFYKIHEKLKKYKKRAIFYAHNAKYDWYTLFREEIVNGEFRRIKKEPIIVEHIPTGLQIVCTMNFLPLRLADIGEKLGYKKGKLQKTYKTLEEVKPYLERDVEIVEKFVEYICEKVSKIGTKVKIPYTASSLGIKAYINYAVKKRNSYEILEFNGRDGVQFIRTKYEKFIRKAYKGGRNIAYQKGKWEQLTEIDQNSQYPWSLSEMEVPDLRKERYLKNPLKWMSKENLLNNYVGVCKAEISIKEQGIGILPINYKGYLMFPETGKIRGYYTIYELREAEKEGYAIEKIYETVFYPRLKINPFKGFIEELYKIRKEDKEMELAIKLLMNGLIGKFAQKYYDIEEIIDTPDKAGKLKKEGYIVKGELLNKYVYEKKGKEIIPKFGCIMLAAECLAEAKIKMYKNLKKIPRNDLIYTDTDNIVFKGEHLEEFREKIGDGLGEFKIKHEKETGEIIKQKTYRIGKEYKISGLGRAQTMNDLGEPIEDLFEKIKRGEVINPKMIGIDEALKSGRIDDIGVFEEETFTISEEGKMTLELPWQVTDDNWTETEEM